MFPIKTIAIQHINYLFWFQNTKYSTLPKVVCIPWRNYEKKKRSKREKRGGQKTFLSVTWQTFNNAGKGKNILGKQYYIFLQRKVSWVDFLCLLTDWKYVADPIKLFSSLTKNFSAFC